MGAQVIKSFNTYLYEAKGSCPRATGDLEYNLSKRQNAIDNFGYGPLNPNEPSKDFWLAKAKMWKISSKEAQTARCYNCAAFNVSNAMRDCIANGVVDESGDRERIDAVINIADLGYCEILDFKCAGSRTCNAWLTNGPLDKV